MRWPVVSRERLTERDAQIAELKAKVLTLENDVKYWINQFSWRSTGVAVYPELLPKQPNPAVALEPETPADPMQHEVPGPIEAAKLRVGTAHPRALIREMQRQKDESYLEFIGKAPAKTSGPPVPPAEQVEVASQIQRAVEDAQKKQNQGVA